MIYRSLIISNEAVVWKRISIRNQNSYMTLYDTNIRIVLRNPANKFAIRVRANRMADFVCYILLKRLLADVHQRIAFDLFQDALGLVSLGDIGLIIVFLRVAAHADGDHGEIVL